LFDGSATTGSTDPDVVLVVDWSAYARGHVHDGERCHLIDGGPVPISVIKRVMEQSAFVKVVVTDGVKVQRVKHFGRHIPAALRTALELGPPPELAGVTCEEAGCERCYGLEWDHIDPVAHGGATSLENFQRRCKPHHRQKTRRDRAAGLLDRDWVKDEDGRAPP